jgi:hypothetical protein
VEQDQAQQPVDAQPVETDGAAASDQPREAESGFMNSLIRRVWGGRSQDADSSEERTEERTSDRPGAMPPPAAEQPADLIPREQFEAERRRWQSQADQQVHQFKRDQAVEQAEAGNLEPIRTLAEAGDRWALQQLSERGDVWARGEIAVKADLAEREAERSGRVFRESAEFAAAALDQAYFEPLIALVDDPGKAAKIRAEAIGDAGRAAAVKTILAHAKSAWQAEAVTAKLADEGFVRSLFGNDAFLTELRSGKVASKMLRAHFRGDLEEPDLAPGLGRGAGGDRENDVMNEAIRGAWRLADLAAPEERSAMAGSRTGGVTHRDLLDDD